MIPPHFLAIVGPAREGRATELAASAARRGNLEPVFAGERLTVLIAPGTRWVTIGSTGILIGQIFQKATAVGGRLPCAADRSLVDTYWGDYVCLTEQPDNASVQIIRAPSGGIHAYRVRAEGATAIASQVEPLLDLGLARYAVDWAFVAQHLGFAHLRGPLTGIAGIDEILPGDCAIERGDRSDRHGLWSPWVFAHPDRQVRDLREAAANVVAAVTQSVSTLIARDDHVLLELSGGLDSSTLAAAIATTGRSAIALNLVTPGPEGDERHYAGLVARHCGIPLTERIVDEPIDLTRSVVDIHARPGIPAMLHPVDAWFERVARETGATAFVSGTGGDCVYCSLGSAAPATDRIRRNGPGLPLIRTLRDIATVHDSNIWTVTAMMVRQLWRGAPAQKWTRSAHFLREDRIPDIPPYHPWLDEPRHAMPGTRAHIRSIMAAYAHLDGYARNRVAPSIYPLLTQPVVETCLAIPTWLWVTGGHNRAVAREGFRSKLPEAVIARRTKGAIDALCAQTFEANRPRLRSFLLDGHLAASGLLDRAGIETYLNHSGAARDTLFYRLLPIADTEAWARSILSRAS